MVKKRERLEVIYDILNTVRENSNNINPTKLQHKSNLSPQMFKEYTEELLSKKLLNLENSLNNETKKIYVLTDKGYEFLSKYKEAMRLIENFGL